MSILRRLHVSLLILVFGTVFGADALATEWSGPPPDTISELFWNTVYETGDDDTADIESFFADPPTIGNGPGEEDFYVGTPEDLTLVLNYDPTAEPPEPVWDIETFCVAHVGSSGDTILISSRWTV